MPEVVNLLARADNPTRKEHLEAARFVVGSLEQVPQPCSDNLFQSVMDLRGTVGALALRGWTSHAEEHINQLWPMTGDAMNTKSHFSLTALAVCETIVLACLRSELALGNRTVLEPLPPKPSADTHRAQTPSHEQEIHDYRQTLLQALRTLHDLLELVSATSSFPEKVRARAAGEAHQLRLLLSKYNGPEGAGVPGQFDLQQYAEGLTTELNAIDDLITSSTPSLDVQFKEAAARQASSIRELVPTIEQHERPKLATEVRLLEKLNTVRCCLRSFPVERPLEQSVEASLLSAASKLDEFRHSVRRLVRRAMEQRDWREYSADQLLEVSALRLREAKRMLQSAPSSWEPVFVEKAREGIEAAEAALASLPSPEPSTPS